jgi:hypothetical protein
LHNCRPHRLDCGGCVRACATYSSCGHAPYYNSILPSKKRDHTEKLTRTLAESFTENNNVALKGIAWTLKEELLLMEIVGKDNQKVKHYLE